MNEQNNKLKDEELFGGFEADSENVFRSTTPINEGQISEPAQIDDEQNIIEDSAEEIKTEEKPAPTKTIKISPPVYKAEETPKKKKRSSAVPFMSAAVLVLVLLAALIYWVMEYSTPMFFISKSQMKFDKIEVADNKISETQHMPVEEEIEIFEDIPEEVEIKSKPSNGNKIPVNLNDNTEKKKEINVPQGQDLTASKVIEPKPVQQPKEIRQPVQSGTANNEVTGEFVIEAYSSESYEDARIWVDKLNRRNLNAVILPQKVRDKVIYKVRFGKFGTRSEAAQTAMNLGLSRSYIDRIK